MQADYTQKDIDRFWGKVGKESSNIFYNGIRCWVWEASRYPGKYGKFWSGFAYIGAHRFSWEITFGKIPKGISVLHFCDNPPCCNPSHLFLGTQVDNMKDKMSKGRQIPMTGEKHGRHKLTWEQVSQIRQRYTAGRDNQKQLGEEFGLDQSTISDVVNYKIWK